MGGSENDRASTVDEDAPLQVSTHRTREDYAFHVAPYAHNVFGAHGVADAHDVLLNDGALVQIARGVVGGGAGQFDPAHEGLMVRFRTLKGRKKTVVNVDHRGRRLKKFFAQHLHVTCKYNEIDVVFSRQFQELLFLGRFGLPSDWKAEKRQAKRIGHGLKIRVVRGHESDLARQLALLLPQHQIVKASGLAGDKNGHAIGDVGVARLPRGLESLRQRVEGFFESATRGRAIKLRERLRLREASEVHDDAHVETRTIAFQVFGRVVTRIDDVHAEFKKEAREASDEARAVRGGYLKDGVNVRSHGRAKTTRTGDLLPPAFPSIDAEARKR